MHLSSKREAVSKIDMGHGGRLSRQTSLMRSLLIFTFLPNPSSHSHSSSKGLQVLRRALKSFYVYTSCNVCEFVSLYSNERRRRKDHGWKHHSLKATEKAIEGIHLRTVVPSLQCKRLVIYGAILYFFVSQNEQLGNVISSLCVLAWG